MHFRQLTIIILTSVIIHTKAYCQATNAETVFTKETNISIKAGTTINFINNALYKKLNDGLSSDLYKPTDTKLFANPYFSIGFEHHFKKQIALHFNLGFYQTLQKYVSTKYYNQSAAFNLYNSSLVYETASSTQYLNNNIFLEILPAYVYKNTRILGGFNITRCSPTVSTSLKITDNTGNVSYETLKDRPEESYHVYSVLGILQGFNLKTHELTLSASYFGLLNKYDSGVTIAMGFIF